MHSHFQNVLIVTKARDNRLIKLTRELALYLMLKDRGNGRGMVVYVPARVPRVSSPIANGAGAQIC